MAFLTLRNVKARRALGTPPDLLHPVSERELGAVPAQVREAEPVQAEAAAEEAAEEGGLHALPARPARDQLYKMGLPGKLILGGYFQANVTSPRPFLLLRICFPEDLFLYNCFQSPRWTGSSHRESTSSSQRRVSIATQFGSISDNINMTSNMMTIMYHNL